MPGYYEAVATNNGIDRYGVEGGINAVGWTYYSGQNGHSLLYVDIQFTSNNWAQAGIGMGMLDGEYQSQRLIYFEYTNGAGTINTNPFLTGYPIPDNDHGEASVFAYQANSDGTYTFELSVSSPSNHITAYVYPNVGAFYDGPVYGTTEEQYTNGYDGTCNYITLNTHSNLSYPHSITTNPTWYLWAGSPICTGYYWTPYNVNIASCPTTTTEWGG